MNPNGANGCFLAISDVVPKLFVGLPRRAGGTFRFYDGEYVAAGIVEAIVGDAVPRFRVIAGDGNLEPDLRPVT
jgi:hypothetical protein